METTKLSLVFTLLLVFTFACQENLDQEDALDGNVDDDNTG